ncbi:BQ2448_5 [Microbotryum intermedium]|uniref:BQ2448_5 protein n=1 Tax=Microbotryum intermedium TaxID=269621 RepID=A0A238FGG4_9BASI|nr:BQ2448_5 [Microbotryum intermedium]
MRVLYAITLALQQDLQHATLVVAKLIRSVESSEDLVEQARWQYRGLQRELREFAPHLDSTDLNVDLSSNSRLNIGQVSRDLTPIVISEMGPDGGAGDDVGTVISKEELMRLTRTKDDAAEVVDESKEAISGKLVQEEAKTEVLDESKWRLHPSFPSSMRYRERKRRRDLAAEDLSKKVKKKKSKKKPDVKMKSTTSLVVEAIISILS